MKLVSWIVVFALALPVLFVVAIALGPVIVGILCAVGFGLVVFAIGNAVVGLVVAGRAFGVRAHRSRL
jgi:polyferredoxin